ncbi:MAG: class I SAM-dependent methyltransferase [Deltaproteobacteria bacterium]|nr:class I SAM-dependent methyltransferase [Deltaproteobacteria bacterium]
MELGAGCGRVLRALLAAGHDAWGLELDSARVARGRARLAAADLPPERLLQGDARIWSSEARFHLVLAPYNLLALFDDVGVADVLGTARTAAPNGDLALEAQVWPHEPTPGRAWPNGRTEVTLGGEAASYRETVVERAGGVLQVGRRWRLPDGSERQSMLRLQIRSAQALTALLHASGWRLLGPIVDQRGAAPTEESRVVYVRATSRGP